MTREPVYYERTGPRATIWLNRPELLNATDFAWDFGDGNTSTNANPLNTYSNAGNFTDTFSLAVSGTWLSFLPDGTTTGPLGAGESLTVTLLVAIPALALPGDSDVTALTATSGLDGSVTASVNATTAVFFRNYLPVVGK